MRIKFVQNLIDKIRGKPKKINISEGNFIYILNENGKPILLNKNTLKHTTIKGKNNTIIISYDYFNDYARRLIKISLNIEGNDNTIKLYACNFTNSTLNIFGDKNVLILKKVHLVYTQIYLINGGKLSFKSPIREVNGAHFHISDGGRVIIEKDCEIGNERLKVVCNGDYKSSHKLHIKEGTHIAIDCIIRTSDGECLLDSETLKPISQPQDVIIGKHCWITSRCVILKGSELPNGTIVAANSLVNKKFTKENTLIGGIPARVLKDNVVWKEGSYRTNMMELEKQNNTKGKE